MMFNLASKLASARDTGNFPFITEVNFLYKIIIYFVIADKHTWMPSIPAASHVSGHSSHTQAGSEGETLELIYKINY